MPTFTIQVNIYAAQHHVGNVHLNFGVDGPCLKGVSSSILSGYNQIFALTKSFDIWVGSAIIMVG